MRDALAAAKTKAAKAKAHYEFAVFHDNNSREAEAIPHYRAALRFGLPRETAAHAYAYLASSLWKTGNTTAARTAAKRARNLTKEETFRVWIERLTVRLGNRRQWPT